MYPVLGVRTDCRLRVCMRVYRSEYTFTRRSSVGRSSCAANSNSSKRTFWPEGQLIRKKVPAARLPQPSVNSGGGGGGNDDSGSTSSNGRRGGGDGGGGGGGDGGGSQASILAPRPRCRKYYYYYIMILSVAIIKIDINTVSVFLSENFVL